MPWRDAITPRTVKALGALAGCMALASGFLLWVEPKMQLYGSEAEVVLPAEVGPVTTTTGGRVSGAGLDMVGEA